MGRLSLALLAIGLLLLGLSLLPIHDLLPGARALADASQGGTYTRALYEHLHERLRFVAGVLVALAACAAFLGSAPGRLLRGAREEAPAFAADLRQAARLHLTGAGLADGMALLLLCALAVALRLAFLNQPIRYDEAFTFNEFASRPLYYGLSFYPVPNNHLLHTLLVHVVSRIVGEDPWALRLPALFAGVLLVPATYAVGALLYTRAVGLLAASSVAVSSILVEYSTNARGYTLLVLAFLLLLALGEYVRRTWNGAALLAFALAGVLGFYTMPTMLYPFGLVVLWLVMSRLGVRNAFATSQPLRSLAAAVLLAALGAFLLYVPPVLVSGPERVFANRFVAPLSLDQFLAGIPGSAQAVWAQWNRDLPAPLSAALLGGFVVGTIRQRIVRQGRGNLVLAALAWCALVLLAQRVVPFERVWLFLLPLYFIIAWAGLALLGSAVGAARSRASRAAPPLMAAGVALLLGLSVLHAGSITESDETGIYPDAEAITLELRGRLTPADGVRVEVDTALPQLQYHFRRNGLDVALLVREPSPGGRLFLVAPRGEQPVAGASRSGHASGELVPIKLAELSSSALYQLR